MIVLSVCMYMYHMHTVSTEAGRGNQIPLNWSYRELGAIIWVLGTEARFSTRAASVLNYTGKPSLQLH